MLEGCSGKVKNFDAQVVGNRYLEELLQRENQEEWVWYHCFNYFCDSRYRLLTATDYNMLSLHLSVYLAQANMYHGSSFILQNGYKVHREAIELICASDYHVLSGISSQALGLSENQEKLFDLTRKITAIYHRIRQATYERLGKKEPESPVSQQLITKVLLGTLGCVPAFDSRALSVFKQFNLGPQTFSPESVASLVAFYQREASDFAELEVIIQRRQLNVPQMKLVDIILQNATREKDSQAES